MSSDFYTKLKQFQEKIQVTFTHESYLEMAMTHRSFYRKGKDKRQRKDNERLEFLGDSVLKLVMSEYLYKQFPKLPEGDLTKMRAQLVSDKFLAEVARSVNLGEYMRFSFGEEQSGGRERASNLSDAFEALLGAIYLDVGLERVTTFFHPLLKVHFKSIEADDFVDFKSQLQELLQKLKCELPTYEIIKSEGPDHDKVFFVDVCFSVNNQPYTFQSSAPSKKQAEQQAAKEAFVFVDSTFEA